MRVRDFVSRFGKVCNVGYADSPLERWRPKMNWPTNKLKTRIAHFHHKWSKREYKKELWSNYYETILTKGTPYDVYTLNVHSRTFLSFQLPLFSVAPFLVWLICPWAPFLAGMNWSNMLHKQKKRNQKNQKKKNWSNFFFLNYKFHPCLVKPCDFFQSWWIMLLQFYQK